MKAKNCPSEAAGAVEKRTTFINCTVIDLRGQDPERVVKPEPALRAAGYLPPGTEIRFRVNEQVALPNPYEARRFRLTRKTVSVECPETDIRTRWETALSWAWWGQL